MTEKKQKLAIIVLGQANSGKSTTWHDNTLNISNNKLVGAYRGGKSPIPYTVTTVRKSK
jgi:hypothetical protein